MLSKDYERPQVSGERVSGDRLLTDASCPKCGTEMEPIDNGAEGPAVEHVQLCPQCYLVTWTDEHGLHLRQGVPMKDGAPTNADSSGVPTWTAGEPKDC
jgi:uncharacterized protein with PIN domain